MVTVVVYTFNTLLLFSYVYGNYDCVCNYRIETAVYKEPDINGEVLGYLYEFDCKPQSLVHRPGWEGIAYAHQIGYVMEDAQIQLQICTGDAPPADRITTRRVPSTEHLKYTSNKQHITTVPLNRTNVPLTSTSSNITTNSSLSSTPVSVTVTSNVTSIVSTKTVYKETTKSHSLSHTKQTKATSLPSNYSTILNALNTSLSTRANTHESGNTDHISSTVSSSLKTDMASFKYSNPTPMPAVLSSPNTNMTSFNRSNPTPMHTVSISPNTNMTSFNRSNPTQTPTVSSSPNTHMTSFNYSNPTQTPTVSSSPNANMTSFNRSNPTPMPTVSSSPNTNMTSFNYSNPTQTPTVSSSPNANMTSFNRSNPTTTPTVSSSPNANMTSFNHSNPTSIVTGRSTSSPSSSSILITSTNLNHVQNVTMTNTLQFNNTVSRTSYIFAILTNATQSPPSTSARTNVTMETQRTSTNSPNIFTLSCKYSSSTSSSEVISTNVTESTKTLTSLGFQTHAASTQNSTDTLSKSSTYHYTEMSTKPRTTTSTLLSTTTGPVKDRVDLCPYQYLANDDNKGGNNYPHFRQYGDFCFEIRQELKDWFSAQDDCVARGGDLAVVKLDEVEARIQSLISTLPDGYDVWIGLSVPKILYRRYHWVDGTLLAYATLTDKGLYTPGSTSGRDCVVMDTSGTWTNVACKGVMNNGTHYSVCQYRI